MSLLPTLMKNSAFEIVASFYAWPITSVRLLCSAANLTIKSNNGTIFCWWGNFTREEIVRVSSAQIYKAIVLVRIQRVHFSYKRKIMMFRNRLEDFAVLGQLYQEGHRNASKMYVILCLTIHWLIITLYPMLLFYIPCLTALLPSGII